jgi:hypothetical protein
MPPRGGCAARAPCRTRSFGAPTSSRTVLAIPTLREVAVMWVFFLLL